MNDLTLQAIMKDLEAAGWKATGPRGLNEPILECSPDGTLQTIFLVETKLSGNLSGFTPFMNELRILDINGNHITGE